MKVGRRLIQCMSANYYLSQLSSISDQESKKANTTTSFSILKEQLGQRVINDNTGCCCVVDSGFSLTHIVPTVQGLAIVSNSNFIIYIITSLYYSFVLTTCKHSNL